MRGTFQQKKDEMVWSSGKGKSEVNRTARQTVIGYRTLYKQSVDQAHEGARFDLLTARGPIW